MKVEYIRGKKGVSKSNIMFPKSWPMRGGKFPKDHPCADNIIPLTFGPTAATDDPLGKFRQVYPDASCFPEGDGICFTEETLKLHWQVMSEIQACFGWVVVRKAIKSEKRK